MKKLLLSLFLGTLIWFSFAGAELRFPISAGTYTPTLTSVTNIESSGAFALNYIRIGNMVVVSGRVDTNVSLAATSSELDISLPFASNFTGITQLGGMGREQSADPSKHMHADVTNDTANVLWTSGSDVGTIQNTVIFMYQII